MLEYALDFKLMVGNVTKAIGGAAAPPIETNYANNIAYSGPSGISIIGAAGSPTMIIAGDLANIRNNTYPGGAGVWFDTNIPAENDGFKLVGSVPFKVDEITLYQGANTVYGRWAMYGDAINRATGNDVVANSTLLQTFTLGGSTTGPPVSIGIGPSDTYQYYYILYSPVLGEEFPGAALGTVIREIALKAGV